MNIRGERTANPLRENIPDLLGLEEEKIFYNLIFSQPKKKRAS